MLCAAFAFVPRFADAQGSPTLTVETEEITGPTDQVVLDIILDPGTEVLTALTFKVLFDTADVVPRGFENVAPAGGAFNTTVPGEVRDGIFYTVDPFDPNDPGGFSDEMVIARITLEGVNLDADTPVTLEIIDAFNTAEELVAVTPVAGAVTVAVASTPTPTATSTPTATATATPTSLATTTPTPTATATTASVPTSTPTATTAAAPTATATPTTAAVATATPTTAAVATATATPTTAAAAATATPTTAAVATATPTTAAVATATPTTAAVATATPTTAAVATATPTTAAVATATPTTAAVTIAPTATATPGTGVAEQLAYPGPFKVMPQASDGAGGFGLNPQAAPGAVPANSGGGVTTGTGTGTGTGGGAPLANTGAETNVLATASISLFVLGGALMVLSRRKKDVLR